MNHREGRNRNALSPPLLLLLSAAITLIACGTTPPYDSRLSGVRVAYVYTHPLAQEFAHSLRDVLSAPDHITADSVTEVFDGFVGLPRNEISRSDLFELKYAYEQWRHAVSSLTIEALVHAESPLEAEELMELLLSIPLAISEDELLSIIASCRRWSDSDKYPMLLDRFAELVLRQGDSRWTERVLTTIEDGEFEVPSEIDGPDKWIRIPPSYKSRWPFERWSQFPDFAQYRRVDGNVVYRGIEFRPGDVLIINLQNPSEGVFTLALDGRNYSPHMGMYVDIETDQGLFPAVYEMHQFGARVVPLHLFLSDSISSYVEVFRHSAARPEWGRALSTSAKEIVAEDQGFNLFADEEHRDGNHYLGCITVIEYLVERAGLDPAHLEASAVSEVALAHLQPLGFRSIAYLSPTDVLQWEQLELVGIIDNGDYVDNIARQLVNERFSQRLADSPLRLDNGGYLFFSWASGLIIRDTPVVAPLLRSLFGHSKENFPMGTKELLAFMELIQFDVNKSVKNLTPYVVEALADYPTQASFSIHGMIDDPEMVRLTDAAMAPIDRWF
jgi:hypothetical protein